ncbi:Adenine-specific DNA methylase [Rhizobiales bacterium GAS113]|nr:Adenine-specific DNA methylase [Rhizobiales bacterium GAS113]
MSSADPFTLDLFETTALASGWTLGAPAAADVPRQPLSTDDENPIDEPSAKTVSERKGANFYLDGDRGLAASWRGRARDNLAAIRLAVSIAAENRPATPAEQAELVKFIGFGASDLANGCFRRPGEAEFRKGWEEIGGELEAEVESTDYASLARCTQYAHYTPEFVVRAIWLGLQRLGFRGGRVLEPGMGTGLFASLMPEPLRAESHVTGIELDPVTAKIARLLHPRARIVNEDFARVALPSPFDLAIGNPPFSDRTVRSDPAFRPLALRLHDFFIVKAIDRLTAGGLAAFVTSHGTMDKADARARQHLAGMADLIAAIRLPEGSFRAAAGTDVVVDVLFLRRRRADEVPSAPAWLDLKEVRAADAEAGAIRVNEYFLAHPEMVLGGHDLTRGIHGPDETYTCRALSREPVFTYYYSPANGSRNQ